MTSWRRNIVAVASRNPTTSCLASIAALVCLTIETSFDARLPQLFQARVVNEVNTTNLQRH